jgi:hypothetical protein
MFVFVSSSSHSQRDREAVLFYPTMTSMRRPARIACSSCNPLFLFSVSSLCDDDGRDRVLWGREGEYGSDLPSGTCTRFSHRTEEQMREKRVMAVV